MNLFLKLTYYLHILSIKLHRLHFHYNLHIIYYTCRARYTNFKVFIVSSILFNEGEILPTIKVNVFPVKESCSNLVNFDYRKDATLFTLLDKLAITLPRVVNDWLIFFSYLKWASLISYALFTFSDPAKSHKFNLAFFIKLKLLESIP